ncbi:hypothetical protein M5W83_25140 [Paenibacillus thiaminolyticus]|uniref:Uncharacterized protein n=1 Tax=Paenibacillus thiaminolyticus TaxID=49283 RepID=A0ABT4G300_PANTH|nr:hypothetical protein [Paenibacillus thiaminolyticus]MCY9538094.1 hypothetical protein [Paenibacillus thiaminolyticus]MCY9605515.1 hypothetical protein [Paenibacillus thiaminolyticus]MCY9610441.1 hypothetical protein [Paenibacillus thiaminolyticus]MCY9612854.1 hypothetical protein [Paenibacillus thiaminolyticus]MCY9621557.1 hypothetical protein [Paenibacillus thiaminolyticus]
MIQREAGPVTNNSNPRQQKNAACWVLYALHLLLAIGAVFGGTALVIDPSGRLLGVTLSILNTSPFTNFLIPGLILLIMLGIGPLLICYALIKRTHWKVPSKLNVFKDTHWSWAFSLYCGFALITWITLQTYFIQGVALIHVVYVAWGIAIQIATLLPSVRRHYLLDHE